MAQIVVDEMVVKLTADVKSIEKELSKIRKEIGSIDENSAKESMKAEQEQVKLAREKSGLLSKAAKSTGNSIKGMMGSLLKLIGGLSIIKNIMSGVSKVINEGRENLYAYSKLTDGSLSKAMDKRNSAIAEFGNAFAAFEALITQALAPVITKIFEGLADIINKFSRVIVELFNLPSYWQANMGIMKQWSTNIKENRQLLSGFDSLNVASQLADDTPIEEMFTEIQNDGSKDGINDLIETVKGYILEAIDTISTWINTAIDKAKEYFINVLDFIDPSGELTEIFTNIGSTIDELVRSIFGDQFAEALMNFDLKGMFEGLMSFGEDLGLDLLFDSLKSALAEITGIIKEIVSSDWFKAGIDLIKSVFKLLSGKASFIIDAITNIVKLFRGEISVEEFVKSTTKSLVENILNPIKELFVNIARAVFTAVDSVFTSIWNMLARVIPGMKEVDHILPAYNKIMSTLDSWVGKEKKSNSNYVIGAFESGSGNRGYRQGDIGVAASGAVLRSPTLIWSGEYAGATHNPEIVTPQNLLDERLQLNNRYMLSAINQMSNRIVDAVNDVSMDVRIGDETIARSAGRGNQAYYKMTGKSLLN